MTYTYLAVKHTPLESKLYMLLVHCNIKCGSSIFPSKRSCKENSFPKVKFKLIFKLVKASLSENQKDFQCLRD